MVVPFIAKMISTLQIVFGLPLVCFSVLFECRHQSYMVNDGVIIPVQTSYLLFLLISANVLRRS